jgi:hypothetical protein
MATEKINKKTAEEGKNIQRKKHAKTKAGTNSNNKKESKPQNKTHMNTDVDQE